MTKIAVEELKVVKRLNSLAAQYQLAGDRWASQMSFLNGKIGEGGYSIAASKCIEEVLQMRVDTVTAEVEKMAVAIERILLEK